MEAKNFDIVTLTMEYDLPFENFKFVNSIWTVSVKALIFLVIEHLTLTLESGLHFEYFYLVNNIWKVSAWALIFHIIIPCDKVFLLVLYLLTLTFDQFSLKINIGHNFQKI